MVKQALIVVIDNSAKRQLKEIYEYIKKDSLQNAEKVSHNILLSIKALLKNPLHHSPDKYRLNNDGSYRAYELYKYRITYHVSAQEIRVIRIRHTKMNPLLY
ncbi:type II toxin-antitoxin system RelE/ParE family toxin [Paraflavitalea soli]|uniref:Type II toxin-antitoxin system RelE/ParE family toxin n=1 Tax=Paraflavitalea soli TaxID=2315862 RepID=A0A3B7MTZ8_9BACT|nr:type II toxin-antitoxin system RelE/ParE family toxin [Paraflavitalea soli]AXY76729.1 type II toxin-antitoxin system RelE/ParE family toxin [Paraflavitalea soli]